MTHAEIIARCVPAQSNVLTEVTVWLLGWTALIAGVIYGVAWLWSRIDDVRWRVKIRHQ